MVISTSSPHRLLPNFYITYSNFFSFIKFKKLRFQASLLQFLFAGKTKMASSFNYLVIVFCTTAGRRGALLGTDEEDLVLLVWVVVDVETKKVSASSIHGISVYIFAALIIT